MSRQQMDDLGVTLLGILGALQGIAEHEVVIPLYHLDVGPTIHGHLALEGRMTDAYDQLSPEAQKELAKMMDVGVAAFSKAIREAGLATSATTKVGSDTVRAEDFDNREKANANEANAAASSAK